MPRKKKKNRSPNQNVSFDSTLKQLQSQLIDPQVQSWLWNGAAGIRQRVLQLNFRALRNLSQRVPLVNAVINTRTDQIIPFCRYATDKGDKGFKFEIERSTEDSKESKPSDSEIIQLSEFFEQTGFHYDPEREDDFIDYISMMVRDIYEIDQIATEVQRNRFGDVIGFWALDGGTIARVADEKRYDRGIRFVQTIQDKVYNEYGYDDLLFDYKYKRSDIKYRGYGYSPVEQGIDLITTLLFGYNYVRDQLTKDKVPKGFISVMGDVAGPQLDSIRNYWYSAMSGAGGQWNIPILPSGKDGVGIDFKTLGGNNRDMEYHKTMMFVSSMMAAVFSIDLMEMGIKTDDNTTLIGENSEPRIQNSKDRGLNSMLSFIEQHLNKILRKVTTKYRFKFVGIEREDQQKKEEIRAKQLSTYKSIDDLRKEDDLELYNEDWSKMPMNQQAVQIFLQSKGAEGGDTPGEYEPESDMGNPEDQENPEDLFSGNVQKSMKDFRNKTREIERKVHIVIE